MCGGVKKGGPGVLGRVHEREAELRRQTPPRPPSESESSVTAAQQLLTKSALGVSSPTGPTPARLQVETTEPSRRESPAVPAG